MVESNLTDASQCGNRDRETTAIPCCGQNFKGGVIWAWKAGAEEVGSIVLCPPKHNMDLRSFALSVQLQLIVGDILPINHDVASRAISGIIRVEGKALTVVLWVP
jgi:hypothetical protein